MLGQVKLTALHLAIFIIPFRGAVLKKKYRTLITECGIRFVPLPLMETQIIYFLYCCIRNKGEYNSLKVQIESDHKLDKACFIMTRSNVSSLPSSQRSPAFQSASSVSGAARSHFCTSTASEILNKPSLLTSPLTPLLSANLPTASTYHF